MGRGDLTNGQWARLEPLLPRGKKPGRPPTWTRRQLINGIRWRTRTGAPWRDVPERYGPWNRAYDLFRGWQRDGTWKRIFEQLQAEADVKGLITWDVSVDSTIARAHQHAAAARKKRALQKEPPGGVDTKPDHQPVLKAIRVPRTCPATRYDKLAVRYEASVLVAAINEWL